jgi:hypothetical protein
MDTFLAGQHGCSDRYGLDRAKDLSGDSFVYTEAAKPDAPWLPVVEPARACGRNGVRRGRCLYTAPSAYVLNGQFVFSLN